MKEKEMLELAQGLQNSNVVEVSSLAKAFLALTANYEELKYRYVKECAEKVMDQHYELLKRLDD